MVDLFLPPNRLNFGSPKTPPNLKSSNLETFLAPIWIFVWTSSGIIFLYISWLPENCCYATRIMRNARFYLQAFSFWYQVSFNIWCSEGSRFGIHFFIIFPKRYPNTWFLDPPLGSSSDQNLPTPASVRRCQIRECRSSLPESASIRSPLDPKWRQN